MALIHLFSVQHFSVASLLRYFHTLRYLKPGQILGRVIFRFSRNTPDLRVSPPVRPASGSWGSCSRRLSMLDAKTFLFLSVARQVSTSADWNRADWPKLWVYNLHYFDDLNADGSSARATWHRALIARWIIENPPGSGDGWDPYPTSLRIVNWIKWSIAGNPLGTQGVHSLAVQARWLSGRLEWHLLGNHLLANAKALLFAGSFFAGPEADTWRQKALSILRRELAEQILKDGGHFERSPMYHAIILADLLDLVQLALRYPEITEAESVVEWRRLATQMLHWLATMTHPDGEIALFNDAAFGIAPTLAALVAYAATLEIESPVSVASPSLTLLKESGYVRVRKGDANLIVDVGEIGPDYLPGHAHADTLSFEFSVCGRRVVVNSGTSEYGLGPERQRQRSTAAHSTAQIDAMDSSEVWSGFRVARRARPIDFSLNEGTEAVEVGCAHDGYRRLKGRPVHRRIWRMTNRMLRVCDVVDGGFRQAVARYHLHPDIAVSGDDRAGTLCMPGGFVIRWLIAGGQARIVPSTWHPEFGQSVTTTCIELLFQTHQATMEFSWD